ncbi:hypothetical protein BYT27DRAFT_7237875 [Phlegmacium glaucopus]|nr:hypothetical protein BYT27DRAFT_7237875 [Phlegmacium glaucopus]
MAVGSKPKSTSIVIQFEPNWAKLAFHHLTDSLLNKIEEHPRYRQAFGFSKDPSITSVKTGGDTLADLLKKIYQEQQEELGSTGQGLIDQDREDEIVPGSKLANKWDQVLRKSPWYRKMNLLFSSNPIVDQSAVVNSQTPVNVSAIGSQDKFSRHEHEGTPFSDWPDSDPILNRNDIKDDKSDASQALESSPVHPLKDPKTPVAISKTSTTTPSVLGVKR